MSHASPWPLHHYFLRFVARDWSNDVFLLPTPTSGGQHFTLAGCSPAFLIQVCISLHLPSCYCSEALSISCTYSLHTWKLSHQNTRQFSIGENVSYSLQWFILLQGIAAIFRLKLRWVRKSRVPSPVYQMTLVFLKEPWWKKILSLNH